MAKPTPTRPSAPEDVEAGEEVSARGAVVINGAVVNDPRNTPLTIEDDEVAASTKDVEPDEDDEEPAAPEEESEPEGDDDYADVIGVLTNLDKRIACNKPPRKVFNALDKAHAAREDYRPALSRPQQWQKAINDARIAFEELESLRQAYEEMGENVPENLRESAFAQKCEDIAQLDFSEPDVLSDAEGVELPRGFGND
jgi:hypothetical protein